jgi:hypothetical protein
MGELVKMRFPDAPAAIQQLPVDPRGYPIPYFVGELHGVPDFRVLNHEHLVRAINQRRCWICGGRLGRLLTFLVGPMCSVNSISAEPPSHRVCANFAAQACPFLSRPLAKRRTEGLPEEATAAGIMIERNPGVTLAWGCLRYRVFPVDTGVLFSMGEPVDLRWWCEGRPATRAEVLASFESGLPALQTLADEEGPDAQAALAARVKIAMTYLPLEEPA